METRLRNQRNVYLMGFMCSGKTKVGSLLAERLGWSFKDTDECIVKEKRVSLFFGNWRGHAYKEYRKNLAM